MTSEDDAQLAATERWLDQLDPAAVDFRDATYVRAVIAATEALDGAEQALRRAVHTALASGSSWTVLAAALGVSPEEAQRRFGTP